MTPQFDRQLVDAILTAGQHAVIGTLVVAIGVAIGLVLVSQ